MNIYVLLKQIPVISDIKIDHKTFTIDRSNAANMANPSDLNALEAALTLKGASGGTVTVLTMGNESCEAQLREAAAVGADRFIRISDEAFAGADTLVTAKILAAAIRHLGDADAVFCGQFSLDSATGQIGGKLASLLDFGLLHSACQIDMSDDGLSIRRKSGGVYEVWQSPLPVVCSFEEGCNKLRPVTLKGKRAAKQAVIQVLTNNELNLSDEDLVSPSKVEAIFPIQPKETGFRIQGKDEAESARNLADILFGKILA